MNETNARDDGEATAVVTGGSGGIGAAAVQKLHAIGMRVAILDANEESGAALAARLGPRASFYPCDVTDPAAMDSLAERIAGDGGRVEALVTSAARLGTNFGTLMGMDLDNHDQTWRVNYHGTLYACRSFGRRMMAIGRGSIVTLGSIHGLLPMPSPAYNPAKAAIARLTQLLAVELGRFGIRVNSVAPSYVMTPRMQRNFDTGRRDRDRMMSAHSLDTLPTPEDVAEAIAFLCSPAARCITGVTLPVDSGLVAGVSYRNYAGGVPWERPPGI